MKALIADDEASFRIFISSALSSEGYECLCAEGGDEALRLFKAESPDIVLLDVMMPHIDGFEVCRRIRQINEDVPVLFLSAKGDIVDKKTGFSNGGDDYLVKPFDEEELLIRIAALLRRTQRRNGESPTSNPKLSIGPFEFDASRYQLFVDGQPVALTPKEFQLLFHLASHPGEVMSKNELIEALWGKEYVDESISIAVYIRRLRAKIEPNPSKPLYLKTVWSMGYMFEV